jgi:hypothetical protein
VLIALPAAVFIVPDLGWGKLLMTGDNVQQNYPLHVLTGSLLRQGQLPYWNQYIFSGSPLLAGFNAGAFYPLVGFFIVLPARAAWLATMVTLFAVIGTGMYAYLRALRISPRAGVVAAITFTFAGTVFSQVNHLDMTEGFAALPWMLLAVLHIVRDGRWRWSLLLGGGLATVILGGAPEAMLDEAILLVVYAVFTAGIDWSRWWRVLTRAGLGAALGLSIATVQWLPGLNFIANSQRGANGYAYATAGSFPPPYSLMSVVPYLLGGYGHAGFSYFFGSYNLPEVGLYFGLLPIIAIIALLHPHWPSRLARRDRLTWYLCGFVGILLALGSHTPLEHLFNALPLYGHQRLQSRNMIDVSMAVCVLFAGWLDRDVAPVGAGAGAGVGAVAVDGGGGGVAVGPVGEVSTRWASWRWYDRAVGVVPAALAGALLIWGWTSPASLLHAVNGLTSHPSFVRTLHEACLVALIVGAVAALLVWVRPRISSGVWIGVVAVFVVLDIGFVAATGQLASAPSNTVLAGSSPIEHFIGEHLGPGGRYVAYDPEGYGTEDLGIYDLNILAHLPSIGGYASIVNGDYSTLTNTHTPGDVNVAQLKAGTLAGLDLQDVATVPEYFMVPIDGVPAGLTQVKQLPESRGGDPELPLGTKANYQDSAYPFYPGPRGTLAAGHTSTWFFGESVAPSSASLLFAQPATAAVVRFGLIDGASDAVTWGPPTEVDTGATQVTGSLIPPGTSALGRATAPSGVGLAMQVMLGTVNGFQGTVQVDSRAFELDGSLSAALRSPRWRDVGGVEGYTLFARTIPPTPIYSLLPGGRHGPSLEVTKNQTKIETVKVDANQPLTIVRDVAWDGGWHGSVTVNGRHTEQLKVTHHGLVQQVVVPPGDDVVTFRYVPPHMVVAIVVSLAGVGFLLAALLLMAVRRMRRRLARSVAV